MLFAQTTVCEDGILGAEVNALNWLDHWIIIDGVIEGQAQFDSLSIEESSDGLTRARCTVLNPASPIAEGNTFSIIWRGEIIFDGLIRTLTIDADQSESVLYYAIEADGWNALLARRTITALYEGKTAGFILRDAITTSGVGADGVGAGTIDEGATLILVDSDHVRMSDFIRDIGNAGGGVAYIDVNKKIQFRPGVGNASDVFVTNARAETIRYIGELDNYRNRQIVKVTGTGGNTVTETRNDLVQQNLRIFDEGGSGVYEAYVEISHPTSDVTGELSILGQTEGYLQLRTYSRNARRVVVTMRDPAPRFSQLVHVDLPGFGLTGTFSAMRKTWRQSGGQFLFDIEFWESSFQQLALESLLRIVGAGKAAVSISANVFPNSQLFSTPGSFTWTVPAGITVAQFTCYGGSGGGGGDSGLSGPLFVDHRWWGGDGGSSGRAFTIQPVIAGNVWDVIVGNKGNEGINAVVGPPFVFGTNGQSGTVSEVKLSGVISCRANPSTGGVAWVSVPPFSPVNGNPGGGIGDSVIVGGGMTGGKGGRAGVNRTVYPGKIGLVEVRW